MFATGVCVYACVCMCAWVYSDSIELKLAFKKEKIRHITVHLCYQSDFCNVKENLEPSQLE